MQRGVRRGRVRAVSILMSLDQIIETRRSVRSYTPQPVDPADLRSLCEAARLAPSACNSQTWRFVVVTRRETIERICREAMRPVIPNRWLAEAPAVIVGASRLDLVANRIGRAVTGIEYYQIDLGIAMEHAVLKATELGLGTCWIGWFDEDRVRRILEIPSGVRVSALLAVGYPADSAPARRSRKPLEKIAFSETWGRPLTDPDT